MEDNKRRMPTGDGIMNDKMFNDLIYAYLQSVSYRDPSKEDRYVWKRDFIKKDVAKDLKMNFRTFQRKFNYLVNNGYVIVGIETYELPKISKWNFYMPLETLKYLVATTNEDVIKVYTYLGQLKESMGDRAYFTKGKLLVLMGYKTLYHGIEGAIERASTNKKDWENINFILDMLDDKLGLIKCKTVREPYGETFIERIYYDLNTKINIKTLK